MIRAATGRPVPSYKKEEKIVRPSSASGKLQSYAYISLKEETGYDRELASIPQNTSVTVLQTPAGDGLRSPSRMHFDRRVTLADVRGVGENAQILTRLNTPIASTKKIKIEERITLEQLHKIKLAFEEADTDGSGTLDIDEFKLVVKNSLGVIGSNEDQIIALFMKIDSSSDGEIDWDEFCTYMQLEYTEKEDALLRSKQIQFILPALRTNTPHHKAPILRIVCISDTTMMCASQDGLFSFWTTDLKRRRTKSILDSAVIDRQSFTPKPTVWVTDVAVLSAHGKLLVATGEREFQFYELLTFEIYCMIIGLDAIPLIIDLCSTEEDRCLILYGDDHGCVSIMMFNTIGDTLKSWKKLPKVNGVPTVTLHDVANGPSTSFVKWKVHNDWVSGLRYFHALRSVISSSNDAATALVRGCTTASTVLEDLHPNVAHPSPSHRSEKVRRHIGLGAHRRQKADQSVFHVHKGVKSFDFCKATNILATGGMDRIVRLWNPYVHQKPTGILRGHTSPIVFLAIAGSDKRIFSLSSDKCLRVWDLVEQNCLTSLNPKLHKVQGEIVACVYAEHSKAMAIAATDYLSLIRISQKEGGGIPPGIAARIKNAQIASDLTVSHTEAVMCCAYNPNFHHVISCSENSVVKLWDFETGAFMFEFNQAHGDSAITALTFDSSGRRLITSGRDGAIRIWNYNNGHCLRSLERADDHREVTNCIYVEVNNNKFIIGVGWDHRVNIFPDETDYLHHVQRPHPHWPDDLKSGHIEDVVDVAFGKPNMLATVSYEGLIIVWNVISGHSIARIPFPHLCVDSDVSSEDEDLNLPMMGARPADGLKAVNKILFLNDRVLDGKDTAALVAGCSDGSLIFWNIHTHKANARFKFMKKTRSLCAMVCSKDGNQLYVANDIGYVTVWDIEDYAIFPMSDLMEGCRCPKSSPPPRRLAMWRAHVQPITWLELVESHDLILTSSIDYTVRVWSLAGHYIGTFGQSKHWDIYDPSTWQHPMVPPEVLLDPLSMPEHPILQEHHTTMEVVHAESLEASDSESDELRELESKRRESGEKMIKVSKTSQSRKPSIGRLSGGMSSEAWKRKLSRRLSRSSMSASLTQCQDEDNTLLEEVKQSMVKGIGKRLRHEKLVAQQRAMRLSRDVSSRAFKTLHYFELADAPHDVRKPNPSAYIDDVFRIHEEEESDL